MDFFVFLPQPDVFERGSGHPSYGLNNLTTPLRQQQTLQRTVTLSGFGFWSGSDVNLELRPAPPETGIVFVRSDLNCRIPAHVNYRIEVPRRTVLAADGATVEMVEHVLAALSGLQIDNCEVWTDAQEMPGFDGSSQPIVAAIQDAGIQLQEPLRPQLVITDITRVGDDECWVEARPAEKSRLFLQYRLDYVNNEAIGRQTIRTKVTTELFCSELAPARTFILNEEAEWLRSQGLAKRTTYQDVLVFDEEGPVENELRFEDECVRHKALDLVGDLALAGCDLVGKFVAYRSGHRLNAELVRALLAENEVLQPESYSGIA